MPFMYSDIYFIKCEEFSLTESALRSGEFGKKKKKQYAVLYVINVPGSLVVRDVVTRP